MQRVRDEIRNRDKLKYLDFKEQFLSESTTKIPLKSNANPVTRTQNVENASSFPEFDEANVGIKSRYQSYRSKGTATPGSPDSVSKLVNSNSALNGVVSGIKIRELSNAPWEVNEDTEEKEIRKESQERRSQNGESTNNSSIYRHSRQISKTIRMASSKHSTSPPILPILPLADLSNYDFSEIFASVPLLSPPSEPLSSPSSNSADEGHSHLGTQSRISTPPSQPSRLSTAISESNNSVREGVPDAAKNTNEDLTSPSDSIVTAVKRKRLSSFFSRLSLNLSHQNKSKDDVDDTDNHSTGTDE